MTVIDFLFPKKCLGCPNEGNYFCSSCRLKIKSIDRLVCPVCENPSLFGKTHFSCRSRYGLNGLISFFAYEGIIREAIHQLKFKYVTDLADDFFEILLKIWNEDKDNRFLQIKRFIKEKNPVLVAVPLFWYKENQRGFNQAEIFAEKFSRFWNLEFKKDFLIRSKFTLPQAGLTQEQRKKNIENVFFLNSNIQSPISNIILVDDIWTTGATLKTCGELLKKSGAKKVWGLTVTR